MKAIIIAAGRGKRMQGFTDDIPKCLLEIEARRLLDYQLEALQTSGVSDISVVVGYQREKIKDTYPQLRYYDNDRYEHNNILHSLFYAEEEMGGEFIAAYSDIFYDANTVRRLLENNDDISIVVDIDWRGYYEGRTDHPSEEAESVVFDANNHVVEIGKISPDEDAVHGEFIGMLKCSKEGARVFTRHFHRLKEIYSGKPFQRAPVFEKAYLTDIFQDMANYGIKINCVIIERGWREIDTIQDFQAVQEFLKEKNSRTQAC